MKYTNIYIILITRDPISISSDSRLWGPVRLRNSFAQESACLSLFTMKGVNIILRPFQVIIEHLVLNILHYKCSLKNRQCLPRIESFCIFKITYTMLRFMYVTLPVVGRRVGPGRSAGRSRWGFSTVAGRFAPPQDSPARCYRGEWGFLPPEVCLSGPADSTGGTENTQFTEHLPLF